jgi:hypothetical protein
VAQRVLGFIEQMPAIRADVEWLANLMPAQSRGPDAQSR